jgi:hypothetical protein
VVVLGALIGCGGSTGENGSSQSPEGHSVDVADSIAFEDITAPAGFSTFVHRTGESGEKWMPESIGAGGGFIDYNGDHWPDILLVGGARWPQFSERRVQALRLYRNNGDGTFTEVTAEAGLDGLEAYGMGVTVADYNNDGADDFYFTTLNENLLFRNEGGRFVEVGRTAGVAGPDEWSTCSVFFDADRDGYLDLYVCGYVRWTPETDLFCTPDGVSKDYCTPQQYESTGGRFYINEGNGTFTEETDEREFSDVPGKSLGVVEFDYNRDGWPDLAVANDTRRDLLFENNGDGTFTEKGITSGIAYDNAGNATGGMGIDAGVIDSTGQVTLVIGNFLNESIGVFQYTSNGMFVYRAGSSRVRRPSVMTVAFGMFLYDVDLDTDLDMFVANGHVQPLVARQRQGVSYKQKPHLFINRGDGTFKELTSSKGALGEKYVARGAAYADLDRDGDLDMLVTENGGPAHLLMNRRIHGDAAAAQTSPPHYLHVRLKGTTGNADGVGARIAVSVGELTMERYIQTGASYLSASDKAAVFGLGTHSTVDELTVEWPGGTVDRFTNLTADQHLQITEGEATVRQSAATRPNR